MAARHFHGAPPRSCLLFHAFALRRPTRSPPRADSVNGRIQQTRFAWRVLAQRAGIGTVCTNLKPKACRGPRARVLSSVRVCLAQTRKRLYCERAAATEPVRVVYNVYISLAGFVRACNTVS